MVLVHVNEGRALCTPSELVMLDAWQAQNGSFLMQET